MLTTLITSKTRIKLLLRFFLNSNTTSYLRNLESELGESTNSIRIELNKFEKAGLLRSSYSANKKVYRANTRHPMYEDIRNMLRKYTGLDKLAEEVIAKLGNLELVFLVGDLAKGLDSDRLELIFVGDLNLDYLHMLSEKAARLIRKKIKFWVVSRKEFDQNPDEILQEPYIEILN